jgi:hypothetical protein
VVQFHNIVGGIDTIVGDHLRTALAKRLYNLGRLRPRPARRASREGSIGPTRCSLHRPGIAIGDIYSRFVLVASCRLRNDLLREGKIAGCGERNQEGGKQMTHEIDEPVLCKLKSYRT